MSHLGRLSINWSNTVEERSIVQAGEFAGAVDEHGNQQVEAPKRARLSLIPSDVSDSPISDSPISDSPAASTFIAAARSQTSLLAPYESVCLKWLARRMPAWVTPDHLTLLGFLAMFFAGACYAMSRWSPQFLLAVNFWLAVNWFGDSLDGTLARFRDEQRPRYGFYVDHMADAFGTLFLVCGLALSGYMSWSVALIGLIAYSLMSINVYLATYTIGTFQLSFYKFSPTELRILLAIGNVIALVHPMTQVLGGPYRFYDVAAVIATIAMTAVMIGSVVRNTIYLYRAERI